MAATTITTEVSHASLGSYQLMQLLQLTSPALPIGGFSWSQGLEFAIDAGWLRHEEDTLQWLRGLIRHSLANLDIPILLRLQRAAVLEDAEERLEQLGTWNRFILASRETAELQLEDLQMGAALRRLLLDLGFYSEAHFPSGDLSYLTAFAMAAAEKRVDQQAACTGFMWSWVENQIAAALKAFPLGQTAGQRIFHGMVDDVLAALQHGMNLPDEMIGNSMPGQIMASMLHEEQYSRLFRS